MNTNQKHLNAYSLLLALVICGLAVSTVTASKIVHVGINFPFSNVVFSMFTYPIIDCICELWGKKTARRTIWLALGCQLLVVSLLQISILAPHAAFWTQQQAYSHILSASVSVVIASFSAFFLSQTLDIFVYQKIKKICQGKKLWLRLNISTFMGQIIDSAVFVSIVFYASDHKLTIFLGSIAIKVFISILMTPVAYGIVMSVNHYLEKKTLAFNECYE